MSECVQMEIKGRVAWITINRPEALNAINKDVLLGLRKHISEVVHSTELEVAVITGAGEKAFVAGADISTMQNFTPLEASNFSALGHRIANMMQASGKIFIAMVQGFALGGGCELAMACDLIYASEKAKFGQPEIALGVIPGFGGTQRLPRRIGQAKALELCLTGEMIDAQQALTLGLCNDVFPAAELIEKVESIANSISSKSRVAIEGIKKSMTQGQGLDLRTACAIEQQNFALCFAHPDQAEGMKAFLEKRPATWKK
ncbi:MAG: enoyl-CoA hydratase/isomerase family protein [Bdellovibrionales bacterium]|nr:enoyl-CoA hydratase/isomerase family protein [Bdellovibrionales bacterium]